MVIEQKIAWYFALMICWTEIFEQVYKINIIVSIKLKSNLGSFD